MRNFVLFRIFCVYPAFALCASVPLASVSTSACSFPTLTPSYPAPSLAPGYKARLIATGLFRPRTIQWDWAGHLLVLQQNSGIESLTFEDEGGDCLKVRERVTVVNASSLTHGLALSSNGEILYASSDDQVFSWDYDQGFPDVSSDNRTVVSGMRSGGHTTRTLLVSNKEPDTLIVSRGSNANIDPNARDLKTGDCQIKAFNMSGANSIHDLLSYDFSKEGKLLGWGLRNSVGVGEHPVTGGIFSVENSIDQMMREGVDIHENNPGEELNFHGALNGTGIKQQGGNYGYPDCLALWDNTDNIPDDLKKLPVGSQIVMNPNATLNDAFCAKERVAPRLSFQAHAAPLDIKFQPDGSNAFVTFHGSWNRNGPVGYKVSSIPFTNGEPAADADSTTASIDFMTNGDVNKCPDQCFRPVGIALDIQSRMFISSDWTGEIYVVTKSESDGSKSQSENDDGTNKNRTGVAEASDTNSEGNILYKEELTMWVVLCLVIYMFL